MKLAWFFQNLKMKTKLGAVLKLRKVLCVAGADSREGQDRFSPKKPELKKDKEK